MHIFDRFDSDYEYTTRRVFLRKTPPACHIYGTRMVDNGYDQYTKKDLGEISISRYKCSNCGSTHEEDHSFREHLKISLFDSFDDFFPDSQIS